MIPGIFFERNLQFSIEFLNVLCYIDNDTYIDDNFLLSIQLIV